MYLDHAATAPPKREVLEAMWPWLTEHFGNPASHHEAGALADRALTEARQRIAARLGVHASEIVFTSGGTESDNAAIKGIAWASDRGRHVVVSAIEHPAVLEAARSLTRFGFDVTELGVDADGLVSVDELARSLRDDTAVVSIMQANNEVGTIQPMAELAAVCQDRGVPLHTDAVQSAAWLRLNVPELGVDALSISGHKLGTPKGIGALYVSHRVAVEPLIHGGGQQDNARSGTQNVAGAVGLEAALRLRAEVSDERAGHVGSMRDSFIEQIETLGGQLTGHRTRRLPGHASFVFPGRSGESLLVDLEARGVLCSSGSACAAGSDEPSHVLTAMGYERAVAQSAIRFTFDETVDQLDSVVAHVRSIL